MNRLIGLHRDVLDTGKSVIDRLVSLWLIGDEILRAGIEHPHGFGNQVQLITNKALTRAVIFRGAKTRAIFPTQRQLRSELGRLRSLQYYYDSIALIDVSKKNAVTLTAQQRADLMRAASELKSEDFRNFLSTFKKRVTPNLGSDRRTQTGLQRMAIFAEHAKELEQLLTRAVDDEDERKRLISRVTTDQLDALANTAIALAGPLNYKLYKRLGPASSASGLATFDEVYNGFRRLMLSSDDRERSRLRKYLSGRDFESIATKSAAIGDDALLDTYRTNRKLGFSLNRERRK